MNIETNFPQILPEKSWYALGRISKFLKSPYPFPDVRSGAYGYETDREVRGDLFLQDLEELTNFLKTNPSLTERDCKRLKEIFAIIDLSSKSFSEDQVRFLIQLKLIFSRI